MKMLTKVKTHVKKHAGKYGRGLLGSVVLVVGGLFAINATTSAMSFNTPYGVVETDVNDYGNAPAPYCTGKNTDGFSYWGYYGQASFFGPNNHSDDGVTILAMDGITPLTEIKAGEQFKIKLDLSYYGSFTDYVDEYVKIWMDWNADSDWTDDGEMLLASDAVSTSTHGSTIGTDYTWYGSFVNDHNTNNYGTFQNPGDFVTLTFTAPETIGIGTGYLRTLMYWVNKTTTHPGPCDLTHEGEIEDYAVTLGSAACADTDNDSICDSNDQCKETMGTTGFFGCPALGNVSVEIIDTKATPNKQDMALTTKVFSDVAGSCAANIGTQPQNYDQIWKNCTAENEGVETNSPVVDNGPRNQLTDLVGIGLSAGTKLILVQSPANTDGTTSYIGFNLPNVVDGQSYNIGFTINPGQTTQGTFVQNATLTKNAKGVRESSRGAQTINK